MSIYKDTLAALVRIIDHAASVEAIKAGAVFARARALLRHKGGANTDLPWTPFEPAEALTLSDETIRRMAAGAGLDEAAMRAAIDAVRDGEQLMLNSRYQVTMRDLGAGLCHLSIKRLDQMPVHDWRDLQRIKDELIGAECEAIEIYPANSRLVDTANQYHLWCNTDPGFRFPVGFGERRVSGAGEGPHLQRPFEGAA